MTHSQMCIRLDNFCCGPCAFPVQNGTKYLSIANLVLNAIIFISAIIWTDIGWIVMALIGIIINGLLLYATFYDNDVLMLVWMVTMGLKVVTLYVLSIILLVSGEEDAAAGGVSLVLQVLVALTLAALNSYFWAVVYSCYRDITERGPGRK